MNLQQLITLLNELKDKPFPSLRGDGGTTIGTIQNNELSYKQGNSMLKIDLTELVSAYNAMKSSFTVDDLASYSLKFSESDHRCHGALLINLACKLKLGTIRKEGNKFHFDKN